VLLPDLHQVGRGPVDDQTRWKANPDEREEKRHDPGEHLLLLALSR
jgi:hypothetical protein